MHPSDIEIEKFSVWDSTDGRYYDYPKFTSKQIYQWAPYDSCNGGYQSLGEEKVITHNGYDTESYKESLEGITSTHNLKNDNLNHQETYCTDSSNGYYGWGYSMVGYKVKSLQTVFEAKFHLRNSTSTSGVFLGTYQHQTGSGYFDWGSLSITYLPPYLSYTPGGFFVNDPTWEEPAKTVKGELII